MMRKFLAALLSLLWAATPAMSESIPFFSERNGVRQLHVDDRPYLILGGELANSSASSRDYMSSRWKPLADMNLNTVLVPVSWELIEPQEGTFDFSLVDGLLHDARAAGQRIVILWFGSWKNSMSSYAPGWVKRDQRRFPRARAADSTAQEILSPFAPANAKADARAFGRLMAHLAKTDTQRTVIMVQVENEIGMLPDARDHAAEANAAWAAGIPKQLGKPGSWQAAYGHDAEEAFSAWHFARYVEIVAAAGKAAYPLPLFVNAALPRPGARPGSGYPSAGPLPHLAEIWKRGAPSIDFLAPDIYFPNFVEWTVAYSKLAGNPLFIPEAGQAGSADATANALFAIGRLDAMGFSPFSIDTIDASGAQQLGDLYRLLHKLSPLILERQGTDRLWAARPPIGFDGTAAIEDQSTVVDGQKLTFSFTDPWTPKERQKPETHAAMLIALGNDEFLVAGRGVTVTFAPTDGKGRTGIERIEEGRIENGSFVPGRLLNGDQSHQGRHLRLPPDRFDLQRVKLYRYQ